MSAAGGDVRVLLVHAKLKQARLVKARARVQELGQETLTAVQYAVDAGATWEQVGAALGFSASEAQQLYETRLQRADLRIA